MQISKLILFLRSYLPSPFYKLFKSIYFYTLWSTELRIARRELDPDHKEIKNSERAVLIEKIFDAYPFDSLLELGCAFGKNFHILAPMFPEAKMIGIDADEKILAGANAYLKERGLKNAELVYGRIEELSNIPDKSFDIVYTCASLLYIPANSIEHVIREMLRIARKQVFILEQHVENPYYSDQARGVFIKGQGSEQGFWLRDYQKLLEQFVEEERIKLRKVPNPIWPTEQWGEYATLVEVSVL